MFARHLSLSLLMGMALGPCLFAVDERERLVEQLVPLVKAMPVLPDPKPSEGKPDFDFTVLEKTGVLTKTGQVVLAATTIVDKGPVDGLEVLACLKGGKNHESYVRLQTANAQLVKAAFIAAFEASDGVPAREESGVPAIGTPLRADLWWQPNPILEPELWYHLPASSLVRDRVTNKTYPALPYVYTGSRLAKIDQTDADGNVVTMSRFMLEVTKSLAVNFDEPDALLASPFPFAMQDDLFEVYAAVAPKKGSAVYLRFTPAKLPATVSAKASGALMHKDKELTDADLQQILKTHFSGTGKDAPALRALGVSIPGDITDEDGAIRLAIRERVIRAAGQAGVWAIPVFIP